MTHADAESAAGLERRLARALHPARPEPGALLERGVELSNVVALAERHGVDALVAGVLTRAGLVDRLPGPVRDGLRAAAFRRHRERAALDAALRAALGALREAGIGALALKGAALGATRYASPAERPMNDVDVLVARRDRERAVEALGQAGFGVPDAETRAFWDRAYYHLPLRAPGPDRVLVELHWGVAQPERHPVDVDALLARSVEAELAGVPARILGAGDMLVHLALHHAYHAFEPRLVWILDRALVLHDLVRSNADPAACWALAREWGARVPFALGLAQVERAFPGLVPAEFRDAERPPLRARLLPRVAGGRAPFELLAGASSRRRQLAYGMLFIDDPRRMVRALAAWLGRAARFGDRAGRRAEMNEARVLASATGERDPAAEEIASARPARSDER